jgi:hypothetical protein
MDTHDTSNRKNTIASTIDTFTARETTFVPLNKTKEKKTTVSQGNTIGMSSTSLPSMSKLRDTKKTSKTSQISSMKESIHVNTDPTYVVGTSTMIAFATMFVGHVQNSSSFNEMRTRSERLKCNRMNAAFSTSMLLTTMRDIPLTPPAPVQVVPAWKLIRPRTGDVSSRLDTMGTFPVVLQH